VRLFLREPSAVFWTFGFPILLSVALGVAFRNRPPDPVDVAVCHGEGDSALVQRLSASTDMHVQLLEDGAAASALRTGKVAIVVVPGSPRTYRFDPTRPESRLARGLVDDVLQRAAGRLDPVVVTEAHVTEPGSRYIDFLIPGLIGLNIMQSGLWGIGYVIVETRTRKLLKRLVATPMNRAHFLLSFVFMRLLFLLVELPVLLAFGALFFDVQIRGSLGAIAVVSTLGAFAFSGIGLLVASRAQNTQTIGGLINLVSMPMFIGSGVFFSATHFPDVAQPFIRVLPLTVLNDGLRAVINEGAGLVQLWPGLALLGGIAAASFVVALRVFRWS